MNLPSPRDPAFGELRARVLRAGGIDVALYKDGCVLRRLGARVRAAGVPGLAGYCARLDEDPAEVHRLVASLTVNVSEFFRNPGTYHAIAREVLPALLAQKRAEGGRCIRIWSAGCATGEEPYSLAILVSEVLGEALGDCPVFIYGTDVDGPSLVAARAGRYRGHSLARVPRPVLRRHFEADAGGYRVRKVLRRRVHFRQHDLLAPFPFRRVDLALCRNVLIYMARPLQERILEAMYGALGTGGFLVLGKVEGLAGPARGRFEVVNLAERIYRKPASARAAAGPRDGPA